MDIGDKVLIQCKHFTEEQQFACVYYNRIGTIVKVYEDGGYSVKTSYDTGSFDEYELKLWNAPSVSIEDILT